MFNKEIQRCLKRYIVRVSISVQYFPPVSVQIFPLCRHGDIQKRIICMTPIVDDNLPLLRYREIQAWIEESQYDGSGSWVVIDDAVHEFPENEPHLFMCKTKVGFDGAALLNLRTRLLI